MGVCIDFDTWGYRYKEMEKKRELGFQGLGIRGVLMWAFIWALPNLDLQIQIIISVYIFFKSPFGQHNFKCFYIQKMYSFYIFLNFHF